MRWTKLFLLVFFSFAFLVFCAPSLDPTHSYLYIASERPDTITVLDLNTGKVVQHLVVGDGLSDLVITPDNRYAFISLAVTQRVIKYDLDKLKVVKGFNFPGFPSKLAISTDGSRLYMILGNPVNVQSKYITVVDVETGEVMDRIEVGGDLNLMVMDPNNQTIYTTNVYDSNLYYVSVKEKKVVKKVELSGSPGYMEFLPKRRWMVLALTVPDVITIVDVDRAEVIAVLATVDAPNVLAATRDEKYLFVGGCHEKTIDVFDLDSLKKIGSFEISDFPNKMYAGKHYLYVSIDGPTIFKCDPVEHKVVRKYDVAVVPIAMSLRNPDLG